MTFVSASNTLSLMGAESDVTEADKMSPGGIRAWPWVAAAMVAVLLAFIAPLVWLPGTSQGRAEALSIEYESALRALRNGLPETQRALVVLTEPAAQPGELRELLPALSSLHGAVEVAHDRAADSIPFAWPLAPSEPFETLRPSRDALARAADEAGELLDDLVDVLNYRAALEEVLVIDALPLVPPLNFKRFKAHLGDVVAAQTALLGELPRPRLFRDHASQVRDAVGRLDGWAEEYVDALWIGETSTAAALLDELRSTREALDATLSAELSTIRSHVDDTILAFAADLEEALAVVKLASDIDSEERQTRLPGPWPVDDPVLEVPRTAGPTALAPAATPDPDARLASPHVQCHG